MPEAGPHWNASSCLAYNLFIAGFGGCIVREQPIVDNRKGKTQEMCTHSYDQEGQSSNAGDFGGSAHFDS